MAKNITHLRHRPIFRPLLGWFSHHWLALVLIAFSATLSYLNYQPGTILTGWDDLHPEYNLAANLKRSLFAVWQEYQSLGLLGGMAHAADLPRQLLFAGASFFLPFQLLRYLWTILMLTLGPLGVYAFLNSFFLKHKFDSKTIHFAAFLGGLFYLLNLATVQSFFTPFETFTAFYGYFPWLVTALYYFLAKPTPFRFLILFTVNFLASPAFYTETLFVVYGFCLLACLIHCIFTNRHRTFALKEAGLTLLAIFLAGAYWLLPIIFFVLAYGSVGLTAKMNLIATPETYARNLAFGNLANLAILRGFWFDFLDLTAGNKFDYLMLAWRNHLANPTILILGYLLFALTITGTIYAFKKKLLLALPVLGLAITCLVFLTSGGLVLHQSIPLLGELFRSPFTKFSTPLSFAYAVFFSIGTIFLLDLFSFLHSRLTYYLTPFTITIALVIFTTPAFTGNLISGTMRLKVPSEYFAVFDFFKDQDPATRIANFPQYTFWGWNYYSWGYRGSGFLWYGIKQPILDRTFDVWEKSGEKYYEEISAALFSEDRAEFERLIDKYAINWMLIDKNIIAPNPGQDLGADKLLALVNNSPKFTLVKNFNDRILIYQTKVNQKVKNFLSLSAPTDQLNPFANLPLRPFKPQITDSAISLTANLASGGDLSLTSYTQSENLIPTAVSYRKTASGLQLKFEPILPVIKINQKAVSSTSTPIFLDFTLPENSSGLVLAINDYHLEVQLPDELAVQTAFYPLTNLYLPSHSASRVSIYANVPAYRLDLTSAFAAATPSQCYITKPNRKIEKIVAGKTISLLGTDLVGCLSAPLPPADTNQLLSLEFTYQSDTGTPANANITNRTFGGQTSPQPILAQKEPTFTRVFARLLLEPLQANLILEANETKSAQEVSYKNITVSYLPLLAEGSFSPPAAPALDLKVESQTNLTVSLPLSTGPLTSQVTSQNPTLNPQARNCDNFNQGRFERLITPEGIRYTAENANSCDQVNLRHLPHDTNYALIFDVVNQTSLFPTICLENHATRRCDVFERLIAGQQLVLQPIANSNEAPGYTLHLFNQSFGTRPTTNLIKSITVAPFPLNFLKQITLNSSSASEVKPLLDSSHPAEFLYIAAARNDAPRELYLYQTKSPYWKALTVSKNDLKLSLWALIAKLPYLYLSRYTNRLSHDDADLWHNAWDLPPGNHNLVIFYLPQYLEFLGLLLLPLPLVIGLILSLFRHKKSPQ